jgi:recombination protein RecA
MDSSIKKEFFALDLKKHFKEIPRVSTGVVAFDIVTNGGIPGGKMTEISGGPSAWKSLLGLQILDETINVGGIAVYVDTERSLEKGLVDIVNINMDKLIYPDPNKIESIEDVFKLLETSIEISMKEKMFLAFVWDSVAATPGYEQLQKEIGNDMAPARRAKLIAEALRKYMPQVFKSNAALVFVNQLQDKIGVMFGDKETTPGGRAIKFWASLRLRLRYSGKLKDKISGEQVGGKGNLRIPKNKVGKPFGEVNFEVNVGERIGKFQGLLDYLVRHQQIVEIEGGKGKKKKYKFKGKKKEFTENEFPEIFEEQTNEKDTSD